MGGRRKERGRVMEGRRKGEREASSPTVVFNPLLHEILNNGLKKFKLKKLSLL